jgi:hypothetical protein
MIRGQIRCYLIGPQDHGKKQIQCEIVNLRAISLVYAAHRALSRSLSIAKAMVYNFGWLLKRQDV